MTVVRSTLLHLPARGSLRAKSGGPLVTVFFRLQIDFLVVEKTFRNKSRIIARVSIYEEFDFLNDFLPGLRDPFP